MPKERLFMKEGKFEDLLRQELVDLYDAEKQILKALPKMAKAASSEELVEAFQQHMEETKGQVERLEKIFEAMGEQPGSKRCEGMQGLLKEGERLVAEMSPSEVLDIGLIAAAQKVEHYEISGYSSVRTLAQMLGQQEAADLLQETLVEEEATDETLTEIAEGILGGEESDTDEEDLEGDIDEEIEDAEVEK
jgi:ferritin-like metal-binding protein YciE